MSIGATLAVSAARPFPCRPGTHAAGDWLGRIRIEGPVLRVPATGFTGRRAQTPAIFRLIKSAAFQERPHTTIHHAETIDRRPAAGPLHDAAAGVHGTRRRFAASERRPRGAAGGLSFSVCRRAQCRCLAAERLHAAQALRRAVHARRPDAVRRRHHLEQAGLASTGHGAAPDRRGTHRRHHRGGHLE